MKIFRRFCLFLLAALLCVSAASADFEFSDERFQGKFTTENLDRIIREYELNDGWYWTTPPYVTQTFHGAEDAPGWTDTAVNVYNRPYYKEGIYGCRWGCNAVLPQCLSAGRGECFGFASFIGYLLSGEVSPHGHWKRYYSLDAAGGVRVGDIVRTEFTAVVKGKEKKYQHSAVVYSVSDEEILFLQISGSLYNKIILNEGFADGYHERLTTLEGLTKLPNIRICRSPLNIEEESPSP
jgi:hypothetical protein